MAPSTLKHELGGGEYWENEALRAKIDGFALDNMLSYISAANIITVYVGPVYYMYASSPTAGHITYMAQYKYA